MDQDVEWDVDQDDMGADTYKDVYLDMQEGVYQDVYQDVDWDVEQNRDLDMDWDGEQAVDQGVKYRMGITIWIRIQVRGLVTRWLSAGETRMPLAGRDGKGIRGLRSRWHGCGNG